MKVSPENEMLAMCFIAVIIIVLASALGGCTTTRTVYVPSGCPRVTVPPEPHYPIQDLKQGDKPDKVAKAYAASFGLAYDYIHEQLLPKLKVYK